jgi:hypothetical protein
MQTACVSAARRSPTARDASNRKNENGLTLVSHAIVPTHDDVRGPSPDGARTTNRGHAIHDARQSRRRGRASWGIPSPIRDDGARPIRGGVRATRPRHAICDGRPNRHSLAHTKPSAQPRRRPSVLRRRRLFEVSFLVPPGERAIGERKKTHPTRIVRRIANTSFKAARKLPPISNLRHN